MKAITTISEDNMEQDGDGDDTISQLALAAIKNITRNSDVAMDLHSAVYIFHVAQALIKHVTDKDAYHNHVGMVDNLFAMLMIFA